MTADRMPTSPATSVLLTVLLTATAVLWGPAPPASACSCAVASLADHYARADAVFTGRLLSRTVEHPDLPLVSSADPATHVFLVDTVLKGDVEEEQAVVSADSGATCGLELAGDGPFAVLAAWDGDVLEASLCGGTGDLTPEFEATLSGMSRLGPAQWTAARAAAAVTPAARPALWALLVSTR